MGGQKSKVADSPANVINNVEIVDHTSQIDSLYYVMIVLTTISAINLALKMYLLHKRSLKKQYLSRGNDLDKI